MSTWEQSMDTIGQQMRQPKNTISQPLGEPLNTIGQQMSAIGQPIGA